MVCMRERNHHPEHLPEVNFAHKSLKSKPTLSACNSKLPTGLQYHGSLSGFRAYMGYGDRIGSIGDHNYYTEFRGILLK